MGENGTYQEFVKSVAYKLIDFTDDKELDYVLLDCKLSMILKDI